MDSKAEVASDAGFESLHVLGLSVCLLIAMWAFGGGALTFLRKRTGNYNRKESYMEIKNILQDILVMADGLAVGVMGNMLGNLSL